MCTFRDVVETPVELLLETPQKSYRRRECRFRRVDQRRELALVAHRASGATLIGLELLPAHLSFVSFEVPRRRTKARARGWTLHSRAGGSRPGRARAETEQQLVANTKQLPKSRFVFISTLISDKW